MLNIVLFITPFSSFKSFLMIAMRDQLIRFHWFPVCSYKKDLKKEDLKFNF